MGKKAEQRVKSLSQLHFNLFMWRAQGIASACLIMGMEVGERQQQLLSQFNRRVKSILLSFLIQGASQFALCITKGLNVLSPIALLSPDTCVNNGEAPSAAP